MKFSLFATAATLLAATQAAVVQFNVVAPGADSVQVESDGKRATLSAPYKGVPYYTGSLDVSGTTYKYITGNETESFSRTLGNDTAKTYNDFFNRPITYADIPALTRPLDNGKQWTRADSNPDLYDTNFIPTFFVTGEQNDMDSLVYDLDKSTYPTEITVIGKDYVKQLKNVSFGIHGAGKSKNNAKQSWKFFLSPDEYMDNRNYFKLRHMEEDPTQMREKLYADCLRAMGTYANQANMVRLFINEEGFGTFNMLDDIPTYSYIRSMFYGGNPPDKMGPLYDGSTGASFQYLDDPYDYGDYAPAVGSPEGSEAIYPLAKAFNETNVKDDASIAKFNEMFDIDQFLRFMVMEYLGGSWDNYWMMVSNDGAYKDYANNNTWYYLGQDYDGTFGVNQPVDTLTWPYTKLADTYPEAILIDGFLQNANLNKTFNSYVVDTVKTLFNNDTLGKHIMAYRDFITPDIKWDRSIVQQSKGINYGWTYDQTYDNLFESVDAPNHNGGGAAYGLTEWIAKKAKVVAALNNFSL
jgi:hypothetical protein